ncbi:ATPase, partial [Lactobacillus helveticus]
YYPESNQTLEFTSHETNFKIQPITSNYDDPFFLNDLLIKRNDRLTTDVEYILLDKQSENYYAVSKTTLKPLPAPSLYEAATNQKGTLAYRGKDARNKYLAGLINLNYFYQHDQLFYNVGMIGNGMQNKEPVASVIRKIECLNNKNLSQLLNVQQLLQSMDVVWVRFKNLTVSPFPIKLMNEYIRKNQNNEKR